MDDVKHNFEKNKIGITIHNFNYPEYFQNKGFKFVSGLSAIDMLFWNGIATSRNLFWKNING